MKKKINYKEFVLTIKEWDKLGICYGLNDLRELARKYNTPIPNQFKQKGD